MLFSFCGDICLLYFFFFFFNDTATTEIYTLSLHDALPIFPGDRRPGAPEGGRSRRGQPAQLRGALRAVGAPRSEEHTSELQSRQYLVCRLLLEKKKDHTRSYEYTGHSTQPDQYIFSHPHVR